MRILMNPSPYRVRGASGIDQVVLAYARYLPEHGFQLVKSEAEGFDLVANHAGSGVVYGDVPLVAHTHGLHWTADYEEPDAWQFRANQQVIQTVRYANEVTVPSAWVAEAFQRDMRFTPHIVPHGIEWQEWQHDEPNEGYVLWNKTRVSLACKLDGLTHLSQVYPKLRFLTTFAPDKAMPNVKETGVVDHVEMKVMVQQAGVYLSMAKETFGIGTLEAMASGVPVLGFANGGNLELVEHGVNGYLVPPGNLEALAEGLDYCLKHRDTLGENGREMAKQYIWPEVCQRVAEIYHLVMQVEEPTVAIVIPTYNYADKVGKAVESAISQSYKGLTRIIVVDDGSGDEGRTKEVIAQLSRTDGRVEYVHQGNQGVAVARNTGISGSESKYIVCLDADDTITPDYLEKIVPHLEADRSLGIAFSGLNLVMPDGTVQRGRWPSGCDFDEQVKGENQVPTCCVFRRKAWERLGGFRQRYAPDGQGSEDAEFWLRIGSYGWGIKQVTREPLFQYSVSGRTASQDYKEVDWTVYHPYTRDGQHPFSSIATPKRMSHPVRQYDEPEVSVVIPVGPGHEKDVINALDSLEAQTFRKWEVVAIWDQQYKYGESVPHELRQVFPYVKWLITGEKDGPRGAGHARNVGVIAARAPFLLFLDADDWLYPNALEIMIDAWNETEAIVYTDYVGRAIISPQLAQELQGEGRLHHYNTKNGLAVIAHQSAEFECETAQAQPAYTGDPNMPFYHWSLVTCLLPKSWHDEIGGYDESMQTWEDIEYHWRMARYGKCYTRVAQELVVYNFHSGHRRELSRTGQNAQLVVEYVKRKFEEIEPMPCQGCGGTRRTPTMVSQRGSVDPFGVLGPGGKTARQKQIEMEKDANYLYVRYVHRSRSNHAVVGQTTGTFYGYGAHGSRFLVHRSDVWDDNNSLRGMFEPIVEKKSPVEPDESKVKLQPPEPKSVKPRPVKTKPLPPLPDEKGELDLQTVAGITPTIAKQLKDMGRITPEAILALGEEGLKKLKGVGPARAAIIIESLSQ